MLSVEDKVRRFVLGVPEMLERWISGLSRLAAILEDAESQFEDVRREVEAFREKAIRKSGDEFLDQQINPTTVAEFIERMFPGIQLSDKEAEADFICSLLDLTRFRTFFDIDRAVQRTRKAVNALKRDTAMLGSRRLGGGTQRARRRGPVELHHRGCSYQTP